MAALNPRQVEVPVSGNSNRLGPITLRIVCTLALFPIVAITSFIGTGLRENQLRLSWFDDLRCLNSLVAIVWVTGMLVIWRRTVSWTPQRKWLTALVCLIPFLQVVYGRPLWTPAPTSFIDLGDLLMRAGQGQIGIGFWLWLTSWIWWGREDAAMHDETQGFQADSVRIGSMSRRIVACLAMMPMQIGCYILLYKALESSLGSKKDVPVSMSLLAIASVAAWIMIWRRAITWTRKTLWQTTWLALALLVLPLGAQFIYTSAPAQGAVVILTLMGWCTWMIVTVRVWPMTVAISNGCEMAPRCLQCGYLLTGLTSTRCPECGDEPTIDALWQATAGKL